MVTRDEKRNAYNQELSVIKSGIWIKSKIYEHFKRKKKNQDFILMKICEKIHWGFETSGFGRVVKLLAYGARCPGFDSLPRHLNFRDCLSPASKSQYGWNPQYNQPSNHRSFPPLLRVNVLYFTFFIFKLKPYQFVYLCSVKFLHLLQWKKLTDDVTGKGNIKKIPTKTDGANSVGSNPIVSVHCVICACRSTSQ